MNIPPQADSDGQAAWQRHYEDVARRRDAVGYRRRPRSLSRRLRHHRRSVAVALATLFLAGSIVLAVVML